MKINEVVKLTGLTKRSIYFYIEERFLTPEINPCNGYYIFSEEDIERLKLLQQLRRMNFSIRDIHGLLKHPASAHVFFQKQMDKLEKEQNILSQKLSALRQLSAELPLVVDEAALSSAVRNVSFPDFQAVPASDLRDDARLVSLFLWGPFLQEVPMTEYRRYLWDKLLHLTAESNHPALAALKAYLYSVPPDRIDAEFATRNVHIGKITSLSPYDVPGYARKVQLYLSQLPKNQPYIRYWKDNYEKRILPVTTLYDSDFNSLVSELSPGFSVYYQNIHLCCDLVYNWLHSETGSATLDKILSVLDGYIDLSVNHHAQLAALFELEDEML